MQHQIFDIQLLKKFRHGNVKLPFDTASTFRPHFLRQYSGLKNEVLLLRQLLNNRVNQAQLADKLVRQLKNHSYPTSCDLANSSKKAIAMLSDFARKESHTSGYCNRILGILTPLAMFADKLRKSIHQDIQQLDRCSGAPFQLKQKFADRGSLAAMTDIIDCYLSELHRYYIDVNNILSKDANDAGTSGVTSHVWHFLTRIAKAIKDSIVEIECALVLFEDLELFLAKIERQELFN